MIFLCIGLPGRFAEWCDNAVTDLAGRHGDAVVSRAWPALTDMFGYESLPSTLDYIATAFIKTGAAHLVLGARQPDESLYTTLAETGARFIVALDDPRIVVAEIFSAGQGELKSITRAVANSCALLTRYLGLPGALTLHPDRTWTDIPGALAAIADHFGLQLDDATMAGDLLPQGPENALTQRQEWATRVPQNLYKMIDGALSGYARDFAGFGLDQITWTRELFFLAVDAGRSPAEPLDLSGGSRILIYGPYIHLPRGSWIARILLGCSAEAAGCSITVDIFLGGVLASATFQPEAAGIYASDLTFSLGEPSGQGVEARVAVNGSASGQMAFGHVVLRRVAVRHPETVNMPETDFLTVLDL